MPPGVLPPGVVQPGMPPGVLPGMGPPGMTPPRTAPRSRRRPSSGSGGRNQATRAPTTPKAPAKQDESAAEKLYDQGWDKFRLGRTTRNKAFQKEGLALLKQCVEKYPDTWAGQQAKVDLDVYSPPAS